MELAEELESLGAIFGNEVTHSEDRDGHVLVNVFVNKKMIVTFKLKGN